MTRMLMTIATAALIAAPAAAAERQTSNTAAAGKAASAREKLYCVQYEDGVGSRARKEECKSKAAWARQGVNVDGPSKS